MSIRVLCDVCGKEMQRNAAQDRIKRRAANVTVEVLVAYKGQWNAGDVCEPCVIKIVSGGTTLGDLGTESVPMVEGAAATNGNF
jgi:hypothetical protein